MDATDVLKELDIFSAQEFLPGCWSTHEAAITRIVQGLFLGYK